MQRPLGSFPLPAGLLGRLKSSGFEVAEDLKDLGVVELSKELQIGNSEAAAILKVVIGNRHPSQTPSRSSAADNHSDGKPHPQAGRSALEMLREEQQQSYVVTFSAQVDGMLGGGVPLGKITEICGAPGVGKTQFSMQLAVDVSIPEVFGGVEGEAVFIDTEGSFVVERVVDIAQSAMQHIQGVAEASSDAGMSDSSSQFTLETILAGIHYYRCHDYLELVALVNLLPEFLSTHPKVRLVLVDSIASPFRHGFDDMGLRNRVLSGMAQNLIKIATRFNVAVVLTNQMTTRVNRGDSRATQLVPALGESWGHACTIRVVLFWSGRERYAMLYKSPNKKETTVSYQVTTEGIRDVPNPTNGDSQDRQSVDFPLSQLGSLSSTQMDELEMSPGYDIAADEEGLDLHDCGQEPELENREMAVHELNREPSPFVSESEMVTASRSDVTNRRGRDLVAVISSDDTCYSQRRSQLEGSRKRPHPDS